MRILYFHQHFSTPKGAAGIRSYQMARHLLQQGHEVIMVCGSYGVGKTGLDGAFRGGRRDGIVDGIRVIEFDLAYSNNSSFAKRIWTFLKFSIGSLSIALREPYDLAFATTTPLTVGIPGLAARWVRRKAFVFEVRDLWPELPRAMGVIRNPLILGAMSALEWASYKSATRCVALSPGIADGIARRGVPSDRILVVPNGCDIDIFQGETEVPWRPESVGRDDLMAIYTGTHGLANGLGAVLDAAAELESRGNRMVKIVLVGDGSEKAKLKQRAHELALSNVIFHAPVEKRRLAGLMASADIGIQCLADVPAFYFGTSPNKFFDYLAAGVPVLNNYPGWVAQLVQSHDCGFTVPPNDPKAFADALEAAANDRLALKAKGRNAEMLARQKFDRTKLADAWVQWVVEGRRI